MLYLLDANVLITANSSYYPIEAVPEFWQWLEHQASTGNLKMPIETYEEVRDGGSNPGKNPLYNWIQDEAIKSVLVLPGEVQVATVRLVVAQGYAADLTDAEVESLGRDPFLIAHALADAPNRCVVTTETSKPRKQRHNKKVPDVCASLGVKCCDPFTLFRTLGFSTGWNR